MRWIPVNYAWINQWRFFYFMPWLFHFQLFQACIKSQGIAAGVLSSKLMAMQQRGCSGTLESSLELFRVTPGKCQCWKAPESICRSLQLHKVLGKSCSRLWYSTDCVMRLNSACSSSSREPWKSQGKASHSASAIMLLKCHGFGHRGAMMRGIRCLGFFLPAPQFLHILFSQFTPIHKGI